MTERIYRILANLSEKSQQILFIAICLAGAILGICLSSLFVLAFLLLSGAGILCMFSIFNGQPIHEESDENKSVSVGILYTLAWVTMILCMIVFYLFKVLVLFIFM